VVTSLVGVAASLVGVGDGALEGDVALEGDGALLDDGAAVAFIGSSYHSKKRQELGSPQE